LIARWYAKAHYGQNEGFGSGDVLLALVLGASIPNIFAIYGIPFSAQTLVGALVGFLCISSILGLIYALVTYIVSGKSEIISIIISNIVQNAYKFTPENGNITILIEDKKIIVEDT